VYSPRRESGASSRRSSCTAPRIAPSGFRTSWASPTAIRPAAAASRPAHLGLELMDAREVAEHDDGGLDLSVPAAERGRDDETGTRRPSPRLDEAPRPGAALARGERLAEPPHDGSVGREDLLDIASPRAAPSAR